MPDTLKSKAMAKDCCLSSIHRYLSTLLLIHPSILPFIHLSIPSIHPLYLVVIQDDKHSADLLCIRLLVNTMEVHLHIHWFCHSFKIYRRCTYLPSTGQVSKYLSPVWRRILKYQNESLKYVFSQGVGGRVGHKATRVGMINLWKFNHEGAADKGQAAWSASELCVLGSLQWPGQSTLGLSQDSST